MVDSYQGMETVGWYRPVNGPHGLKVEIPFFGKRDVPKRIIDGVPSHQREYFRRNTVQILISTFGSYMWINIDFWQIVDSRELEYSRLSSRDLPPAQDCFIGGSYG